MKTHQSILALFILGTLFASSSTYAHEQQGATSKDGRHHVNISYIIGSPTFLGARLTYEHPSGYRFSGSMGGAIFVFSSALQVDKSAGEFAYYGASIAGLFAEDCSISSCRDSSYSLGAGPHVGARYVTARNFFFLAEAGLLFGKWNDNFALPKFELGVGYRF